MEFTTLGALIGGIVGGGGLTGTVATMVSGAVATVIICAVGVFVDISVITVAPIAMAIAEKAGYNNLLSVPGVLRF